MARKLVVGKILVEELTVVAGIPIPSTSPVFLTIVGFHVLVGLVCVVTGIVAMLSRKAHGRHSTFGTMYFWGLAVLFVSATALSVLRWQENTHLFVLGVLAFGAAVLGRTALRRRLSGWPKLHIAGMGSSYVLMLTAFYVDNGKNLPLWRELPQIAFWIGPAVIGAPIILYAMLRHPVVRRLKPGA